MLKGSLAMMLASIAFMFSTLYVAGVFDSPRKGPKVFEELMVKNDDWVHIYRTWRLAASTSGYATASHLASRQTARLCAAFPSKRCPQRPTLCVGRLTGSERNTSLRRG
ncbi:hypothetical protein AWB76_07779 [Caballeronia temeraria]|uniref:Uncharacterized protein n=1 Tax=Caballeronia temeraria TaxID=1777137 RepID=A0A158DYV2_9BURK|nr:hypothetical protein AWB76_07779 [Caballeronia temeraria]